MPKSKNAVLIKDYVRKLKKSLERLRYSHQKVIKLSTETEKLTEDELGDWESFTSRFARASDLFLSKLLRALVLRDDPGFQGGFRDFLDRAEKLGYISSADIWMEIRELRNTTAHEYTEEDLAENFGKLLQYVSYIYETEKIFPLIHAT